MTGIGENVSPRNWLPGGGHSEVEENGQTQEEYGNKKAEKKLGQDTWTLVEGKSKHRRMKDRSTTTALSANGKGESSVEHGMFTKCSNCVASVGKKVANDRCTQFENNPVKV